MLRVTSIIGKAGQYILACVWWKHSSNDRRMIFYVFVLWHLPLTGDTNVLIITYTFVYFADFYVIFKPYPSNLAMQKFGSIYKNSNYHRNVIISCASFTCCPCFFIMSHPGQTFVKFLSTVVILYLMHIDRTLHAFAIVLLCNTLVNIPKYQSLTKHCNADMFCTSVYF